MSILVFWIFFGLKLTDYRFFPQKMDFFVTGSNLKRKWSSDLERWRIKLENQSLTILVRWFVPLIRQVKVFRTHFLSMLCNSSKKIVGQMSRTGFEREHSKLEITCPRKPFKNGSVPYSTFESTFTLRICHKFLKIIITLKRIVVEALSKVYFETDISSFRVHSLSSAYPNFPRSYTAWKKAVNFSAKQKNTLIWKSTDPTIFLFAFWTEDRIEKREMKNWFLAESEQLYPFRQFLSSHAY